VLTVRDATDADIEAITAIHNALLATTTCTWTDRPDTVEERRQWWRAQHEAGRPVLVAVDAIDGVDTVVGFASYGDFRDACRWPGYRYVVEHTVHVRSDRWNAGAGRSLVEALVTRARAAGKRQLIGAIDGSNARSLAFHERLGFTTVGRLPAIGFKHDTWLDLVLVQRALADS
jgi:L-amino acid N-acyltransferase YncA